MKAILGLFLAAVVILMTGCPDNVKSTRRFQLPQGSADAGKAAFVALNCTECHTVVGVTDLPKPTAAPESVIALGGEVARMRTVGDLLTSIVHPSFSLSEKMKLPAGKEPVKSPMRDVNEVMTVKQMIDLITFLHPKYTQLPAPSDMYYVF